MTSQVMTRPLAGVLARRRRSTVAVAGLAVAVVVTSILATGVGQVSISPGQSVAILVHALTGLELPWSYDATQESVLLSLRLPRVVLGCLVGAALALAGATLQGLFRNPLADPTLLGVSSGAALGVAVGLVFGGATLAALGAAAAFAMPLLAMVGGLAAVSIVWTLSTRHGRTSVVTMLLAGIAINAICGAGVGLCVYAADDAQLRDLTFWTLGSLNGATWTRLGATLPLFAAAFVVLPGLARSLNAMLLGEAEARHLGVRVHRIKRTIVVLTTLAVGAAVSLSGVIGFVGLVVPHTVRLLWGPDHRTLIPASALLGALVLVIADVIARTVVAPADLPIGVVTALIGSPMFLWLLVAPARRRGGIA